MPDKLQLDLPILLPDVPDARDACVRRLTASLEAQEGVEHVHVLTATDGEPAKLCIHYDPDGLPLPRIRQLALRQGARITDQYGHVLWEVRGILHQRRARTVAERLRHRPGVLEAEATAAGLLRVEFDRMRIDKEALREVLREMGVRVVEREPHPVRPLEKEEGVSAAPEEPAAPRPEHRPEAEPEHDHGGVFGEKTELIFAIISGVCVGLGWGLETFTGVMAWIPFALYLGGYFFGGFFTLREAIDNIRVGRFEIDFLMLVAAAGAAVLGEWFEGALLLFLFSMGHALEHYAMGRARRAIEALADLAPDTAIVHRGGEEREIPVEELEVGDVVIVRPDERIPADGFVLKGTSAVNQAPVTGESVPVDKKPVEDPEQALERWQQLDPEHRVFAGTINGSGALEVVVARRSTESTLARVVQLVTEAETQKSPTQRFTDRFERVFVPAVLGFVVLLLFAWVVLDEPFAASFYRAMAVLVAASPCALAIATPSAVLSGVARAGRGGVLVKGGGPLENLGTLSAIAFDKTGTLTEGNPRVTDVVPAEDVEEAALLRTAVAVEKLSDHPLARAVVRLGRERLNGEAMEEAHDLESITGRGVRARLDGEVVYIGKDDLFREVEGLPLPETIRETVERLETEGRTTMIVRRGERYLGVLGLMDTPREAAAETVVRLRELGMRRMVMISGDNQRVVDAIARQVGLDEAYGDLMPDDKVDIIQRLSREEKVAMVGDGVNDAPAMANATVGIAMGAAGSDVALETADVALMADRLEHLPFAVGLSRQTSRIIRQNLWMSLGMVVFLIPATLFGLGIGPAVALHEGSTLVVVFNALRLLAYRAPGDS
ncbi:heavy metal translocating P-type ATPase [Rhodocaloribacter litoris]|uniref:heavy metal translocating P-type ATPase n=1 Tax=Rhodocaloribacter litoris TaxID=2558931 RepID=UPI000DD385CB|nr:heavy metal translocating P-type ATPase [Rhodocaloribacter litoris]QXD13785.1 heavy metal translocating P-type ATPase [Rhodocaloribacter litoris]